MKERLYIVIPCYNEEAVLEETARRITIKLISMIEKEMISSESRIVFVDDGSSDDTWRIISRLYNENEYVCGIKSSRNRGHQNTLLEGMFTVREKCDIVVTIDADLQDDIEVLDEFVKKYNEGYDVVYGVRNSRKTDSWFKRTSARIYYLFMKFMGAEIVYDHADYRLLSSRVIKELGNFKEVNLFLRGIVPMVGFKSTVVKYDRAKRFAGESKYPLKKMIAFAVDGITSLSVKPIRMIMSIGMIMFLISMVLLVYYIIGYFKGNTIAGWATLVVSIWGIGGIQLFAIGIIGEYIGKIYLETKARPRYIIEDLKLK